jgi:transformation/transcription domain-associated protein
VLDESGTLVNLLQLWQLVVRHPDVFYESRAQFVPQMINTLSRIGMPTTASLENRWGHGMKTRLVWTFLSGDCTY